MAKVNIVWSDNEGNHANKPFRDVRDQAIRALIAQDLPDVGNNVGYEAHQIMLRRARAKLARVATCVRQGIESSDYETDDIEAIRRIARDEPAISMYSVD